MRKLDERIGAQTLSGGRAGRTAARQRAGVSDLALRVAAFWLLTVLTASVLAIPYLTIH